MTARNRSWHVNRRPELRRAFSLIEILVVMFIIAFLVALLVPGLREARRQTKGVFCRNNLRGIWTGIRAYVMEFSDRVPFMEDVNLTDPNADPFDARYPSTVGVVLLQYVQPDAWVCPSAVTGFPASAPAADWKMTYAFSSAGAVGEGVPYDDDPLAGTGDPLDPAISNYVHFDGRPVRLLDGRRYVQSFGLNKSDKGYWNVRFPIIADILTGEPALGKPKYPHHGTVERRADLINAKTQFELNTGGNGKKNAYHELHADGERADTFLTRYWVPHWPGY